MSQGDDLFPAGEGVASPSAEAAPAAQEGDLFESMSKDELAEYAKRIHQLDLEMSKNVKTLRNQLRAVEKSGIPSDAVAGSKPQIEVHAWYRNRRTGAVWPARSEVLDHPLWVPCQEDGSDLP